MMDPDESLFVAAGIAGYALAIEMLVVLHEKGIIDEETFRAVLDRAMVSVENLRVDGEHELSRIARDLLWAHIGEN